MQLEQTPEGLSARLAPRGVGRFFSAAFLAVWLAFWAAGEAVALSVLLAGAYALLTGQTVPGMERPPDPGAAFAVGAFLLLWLTLWTIGGIMAARELLRLVWSEQVVTVLPGALRFRSRIGPFVRTREFPRDAVHLRLLEPPGTLLARVGDERVELTRLGTPAERAALRDALSAALGLTPEEDPVAAHAGELPEGWIQEIDPEGRRVLLQDPVGRRRGGLVVAALAVIAGTFALAIVWRAIPGGEPQRGTIVPATAGLLLGFAAWRLLATRIEWCLSGDRLIQRRRGPSRARTLFEGTRIELDESRDGDGDCWYRLAVLAADTPPRAISPRPGMPCGGRRTLLRTLHDPLPGRRFGTWLAREGGLAFDDAATPDARRGELARQLEALRSSGRLGRFVARHLEGRLGER